MHEIKMQQIFIKLRVQNKDAEKSKCFSLLLPYCAAMGIDYIVQVNYSALHLSAYRIIA